MKIHHLSEDEIGDILVKVRALVDSGDYPPEKVEEIFTASKVDGAKFLECKAHPIQSQQANFQVDRDKGIRYFDPFNFFTGGIYKDVDGWTLWTADQLKEPWQWED